MYANKYKFMTVDEADPSLDKPISRWYEVVIHPLSSFRKWWDLLIIVFILWNIVVQLVKIAFYWHDPLLAHGGLGFLVLNIVIDFFFMADLILNFNTGYFQDLDQVLVMDRRRIAWTYLKGWFFIDLVSSIPFDLILISATSNGSSTAGRLPKLLRVLKITRLLRLLRVTKMARYLTKYNFFSSLSTFVSRILSHVVSPARPRSLAHGAPSSAAATHVRHPRPPCRRSSCSTTTGTPASSSSSRPCSASPT